MGKYANLVRRAAESVDYWTHVAIRNFTGQLADRLDERGMKRADLAEKIGSSPAYVTKVLRGEANFTLETMTKLAMAVGAHLQVRMVDNNSHMSVAAETPRNLDAKVIDAGSLPRISTARSSVTTCIKISVDDNIGPANEWNNTVTHPANTPSVTPMIRAA